MTDSLTHITVTTADALILPLVKRFFHSQGMRSQAAKADQVVIARDTSAANSPIIAALRLCPLDNSWLLRSMSVAEKYRRQRIGLYMLDQIRENLKAKKCYCFPYAHLESFYSQGEFKIIDAQDASDEIQQLYRQYLDSGKGILIMQIV
ncbi:MAG: hypothetical protein OEY29_14150 [Gammaproteobacteria bacterium]|nr:hypothetical protein [Gammaproteobacteria bacterium]